MSAYKQRKERNKAIHHLFEFIQSSPDWHPLLAEYMGDMLGPIAQELDIDVNSVAQMLFDGPFSESAYNHLIELMATTTWAGNDCSAIDAFLKQRGWRESSHGRNYLRALNGISVQFLEVCDVKPEHWIEFRTYGTTEPPVRVKDHAASQMLKRYDAVLANIIPMGRTNLLGSILPLPLYAAEELAEDLACIPAHIEKLYRDAGDDPTAEELAECLLDEIEHEKMLVIEECGFQHWVLAVLDAADSSGPKLHNTDGDEIIMSKYRFPITGQADQVRDALNLSMELLDDQDNHWSWVSTDEKNTVLGHLELSEKFLLLRTNSVQRGERGMAMIQALLGENLLGDPMAMHERTSDAIDAMPGNSSLSVADMEDNPELQAMLGNMMKEHYMRTLDEPIPMLDNNTPRACAADPGKRDKVLAWLKHLENNDARAPTQSVQDFTWMWEELGLSEFR